MNCIYLSGEPGLNTTLLYRRLLLDQVGPHPHNLHHGPQVQKIGLYLVIHIFTLFIFVPRLVNQVPVTQFTILYILMR